MTQLVTSSDHLLRSAIEKEFEWVPDVVADHIGVGVTDGIVTLSGQVTTYPEEKAAVASTLRVRGVTGVAEEILVQHHYGQLEDSDIAREATTLLRASAVLPQDTVKATVEDHHVRLAEPSPWNYQRESAAKLVSGLPGVVAVQRHHRGYQGHPLGVIGPTPDPGRAVRNAQVDSRTIEVHESGTTIELTEQVQSWAEFRQASHAAWATPGVTRVRNPISVIS